MSETNISRIDEAVHVSNELSKRTDQPNASKSWTGYLYMLCAALSSAFGTLLMKMAANEEKIQIVLIRCLLQYIFLLPLITYKKMDILGENCFITILLLLRGILGSLGIFSLALSMKYLSLGDAVAISYTFPALVSIFAHLFLKEKCSVLNLVLTIVSFAGVLFVVQPNFLFGGSNTQIEDGSVRVVGVLWGISAAVLMALVTIIIRRMGEGVHFCQSLFYYSWEGAIFSAVYISVAENQLLPCFSSLPVIVGSGILLFGSQICVTMALQRERAAPISLIKTSEVMFAFLLQYFILSVQPTLYSVIGAVLILCSTVLLTTKSAWKTIKLKKCFVK